MLKVSDYIAIMAGFFGIFVFYLVFSGNLVLDYGAEEGLPVIEREIPGERQQLEFAEYVVLYGNEKGSEISYQIMSMLDKLKKDYVAEEKVKDLNEKQLEEARVFIVTTGNLSQADEQQWLLNLAEEEGKYVFFTALSGENPDYESRLGILKDQGEIEIDGMMIFEGILTQGMVYYEELPMTVRSITLDASCTKMIQERNKEKEAEKKQRELIPLLWKKQFGEGRIYSCNAPFFSEEAGIGIFAGILSDMEETFLYPVVNSNALLLDYYPEFEHVDSELILKLYSRDPVMYVRDVIWPSLDKIRHSEKLILSGRSHMENKTDDFYDFQKQIQRSKGIVLEADEGDILPIVCEGHVRTDEKRYWMESAASGEGLASFYLNMREVLGDKGEEEGFEWASYSFELAKCVYDIYRNNHFLEAVNWKEAEERFKRYEKIRPEYAVTEDSILIHAEGFVDVWYCMVRTERKLEDGPGYEVEQVGDDAYLLEIRQQEVAISID